MTENDETTPTPVVYITIIVIYLLAVVLLASLAAYCSWPAPLADGKGPTDPAAYEKGIVRFVFCFGVLGACLHAMTSVSAFVGLRKFLKSWTAWYVLRPLIGGILAWVVYLMFRGGLFKPDDVDSVNPYTFGALAAIAGMFSEAVTKKIGDAISVIFNISTDGSAATPQPKIDSTTPDTLSEQSATTALTIAGSGFATGSVVDIGGKTLNPKTIAATKIEVDVPRDAFTGKATVDLVVRAPQPSRSASKPKKLNVTK